MQLTAHFQSEEFQDRRDGSLKGPSIRLIGVLEHLRGAVGRPLIIVSGYRSPATNRAIGGAEDSRHMHGDAADLPAGYATVDQAVEAGAVGIGNRGPWAVHVDTRPGPPARWSYPV